MVKRAETRTYGGSSGDERAAARRTRLLDAAFALVAAEGWRELRIASVCAEAGLNKRYFYESFADLDALGGALIDRLAEDAIRIALSELGGETPTVATAEAAVRSFATFLIDDPRRARVLFGAAGADDRTSGHRAHALRRLAMVIATGGRDLHGLEDDPVVELTASMLVGGVGQILLDWLDGRLALSHDELITEMTLLSTAIGDLAADRVRRRTRRVSP